MTTEGGEGGEGIHMFLEILNTLTLIRSGGGGGGPWPHLLTLM